MKLHQVCTYLAVLLFFALRPANAFAQTSAATEAVVPTLIRYSGTLSDSAGKPVTGMVGVTFYFYQERQGGAPLWMETQNVQPDKNGRYTVMLGATKSQGLPTDLFSSGAARWLAVRVEGRDEQPRVMLVAVPYALKAGDAQTIGGLPPSAFVLAAPVASVASASTSTASSGSPSITPAASSNVTTTGGAVNAIPLFTTATNIQNSILTQAGTTTVNIAGKLNHPAKGVATAAAGKNSQPDNFVASSFNSSTAAAVVQSFQLQAEPAGNNTGTPSGTLNLLYGSGATAPAETGLRISSKGVITFAPGQTFPGGSGTVTSVGLSAPASDFTVSGSPVTTTGTLGLKWTVSPTSANTANAIVKRDSAGSFNVTSISATGSLGSITGSQVAVGGNSSATSGTGIAGTATGAGDPNQGGSQGVLGNASGTGLTYGVEGLDSSSGMKGSAGVAGFDLAHTPGLPAWTAGVYGNSVNTAAGFGVFGEHSGGTGVRGQDDGNGIGVDGESANGWALFGNTGDDNALVAQNDSAAAATIYGANLTTGNSLLFYVTAPLAANPSFCEIDTSANLACTGSITAFVAPPTGGRVAMHAVQSPENWFEDFGSARLVNGSASVPLDPKFAATVNLADYHVFLTPRGECEGLYVAASGGGAFEVRELRHGSSNVEFDYRIVAKRLGFENQRMENIDFRTGNQTARLQEQLQKHKLVIQKTPQPKRINPANFRK